MAMLLAFTPLGSVQASTFYGFNILDKSVTSDNCDDLSVIPGVSGTVTYDPATNTLTLVNATITDADRDGKLSGIANLSNKNLVINVVGTNTITSYYTALYSDYGMCTYVRGSGTLNLKSSCYYDSGLGTFRGGSFVLEDCTVNTSGAYGILGNDGVGSVTVRYANVTAEGASGSVCNLTSFTLDGCRVVSPDGAVYDKTQQAFVVDGKKQSKIEIKADEVVDCGITIADVVVTSKNCGDLSVIPGVSGTATYDPTTTTLFLDGATIESKYGNGLKNRSVSGLKIDVKGDNSISANYVGMELFRSTTIGGGGTLSMTVNYTAISVNNTSLVIDSCTVNATGKSGIAGTGKGDTLTVREASVDVCGSYYGSVYDITEFVLEGCIITVPEDAEFDSSLKSVALDGETVNTKVQIEQGTRYDVVLEENNGGRVYATKLLQELLGMTMQEAFDFLADLPGMVVENVLPSKAQEICDRFAAINCTANKYPSGTWSPIGIESVDAGIPSYKPGVYSVGGVYLGNDFDNLPKGFYIKDGRKVLKLR